MMKKILPILIALLPTLVFAQQASELSVDCGDSAKVIAVPDQGWHFVQWQDGNTDNPRIVLATGDITYYATFAIDQYLITFVNYDGSELQSSLVDYGTVPTYLGAENPVRPATVAYTYTFSGWNPEPVSVTGSATYTAQYDSTKVVYDVDITVPNPDDNHGTVTVEGEQTYGDTITITATPEEGYHFVEWSDGDTSNPREVEVTGDIDIYPIYAKDEFLITFVNYDGTVLQSDSVEYGETPEYNGETPAKPATVEYTYTFADWEPTIAVVTEDATYTAQFDSTKIIYDVNVTIPDTIEAHGTVIIDGEQTYGDTIVVTAEPEDGWYFVEWSDGETDNPREIVIEGDTAIYPIFAQCEEIIVNLTKTIYNGQEYVFGAQTLTQKGTYTDTLTLANGCDSVVVLKLNVVNSRIKYNLSVVVNDASMGSVTGTGVFKAGTEVTITATPVSNKYIFVRWYNEDENIDVYENPYTFTLTRNLQLRAVFKKAPRREPERESQPGFTKGNKKNINK